MRAQYYFAEVILTRITIDSIILLRFNTNLPVTIVFVFALWHTQSKAF